MKLKWVCSIIFFTDGEVVFIHSDQEDKTCPSTLIWASYQSYILQHLRGDMESIYTELTPYGIKIECARTDNVLHKGNSKIKIVWSYMHFRTKKKYILCYRFRAMNIIMPCHILIRKGKYRPGTTTTPTPLSRSEDPSSITKWAWLESSGRRLISSISITKKKVFFWEKNIFKIFGI